MNGKKEGASVVLTSEMIKALRAKSQNGELTAADCETVINGMANDRPAAVPTSMDISFSAPKQGGNKKRLLLIAAAAVVLLVVICVVIVALSGDKDPTDDATDVSGESVSASEEATGEQSSTDYVTDAESTTAAEGGQDTNAEDPSTIGPQENEVHDDRENDAAEIPETKGVVEFTTADAEIPESKPVA